MVVGARQSFSIFQTKNFKNNDESHLKATSIHTNLVTMLSFPSLVSKWLSIKAYLTIVPYLDVTRGFAMYWMLCRGIEYTECWVLCCGVESLILTSPQLFK